MTDTDRPSSRRAVGALAEDGCFLIYGGFGPNRSVADSDIGADLWRWDGMSWTALGDGPYGARYPSLIAHDGAILMFGGCGWDGEAVTFLSEVWRRDSNGWTRLDAGGGPSGRYTSPLAVRDRELIVFGGMSQDRARKSTYWGELWAFHLDERRWRLVHDETVGPGRRYGGGWCSDAVALTLYGGYDGVEDRGDLWRLDLETLNWTRLAGDHDVGAPVPRYCPALGRVDGALVLFGGRSKRRSKENHADTWVFADGAWTELRIPGPPYHAKPAFASDGRRFWMGFGEGRNGHVSDLWCFSGGVWRQEQAAASDDPQMW